MMTFSKIGEEAYFYRVCFYLGECNIAQNQSLKLENILNDKNIKIIIKIA